MRMAQLAEASGLPVATIKFYLREGLVPPGAVTSATQAQYDEGHVRRLRLVRAMTETAGLSLDAVHSVLAAVDDDSLSWHTTVATAHRRLSPGTSTASADARERVQALASRRGWTVGHDGPHAELLARALDDMAGLDHPVGEELLDAYADAAQRVAEADLARLTAPDREDAVEHVVVGTLLMEPVLLALRRIAQANVSARTRG